MASPERKSSSDSQANHCPVVKDDKELKYQTYFCGVGFRSSMRWLHYSRSTKTRMSSNISAQYMYTNNADRCTRELQCRCSFFHKENENTGSQMRESQLLQICSGHQYCHHAMGCLVHLYVKCRLQLFPHAIAQRKQLLIKA